MIDPDKVRALIPHMRVVRDLTEEERELALAALSAFLLNLENSAQYTAEERQIN
jgi:hypothetical protein